MVFVVMIFVIMIFVIYHIHHYDIPHYDICHYLIRQSSVGVWTLMSQHTAIAPRASEPRRGTVPMGNANTGGRAAAASHACNLVNMHNVKVKTM